MLDPATMPPAVAATGFEIVMPEDGVTFDAAWREDNLRRFCQDNMGVKYYLIWPLAGWLSRAAAGEQP